MKAMIFAAGLGTRLKPFTDSHPKALVEVGGQPMLGLVIEKLKRIGVSEIVVNVHHFASQITEYLKRNNNFGITVHISDESDFLLDTGGGILAARRWLDGDEPFIVHNADILTDVDILAMRAYADSHRGLATLLVAPRDTKRYLLFNPDDMQMKGWVNIETSELRPPNIPDAGSLSRLAFAGVHILHPAIFPHLAEFARHLPASPGSEVPKFSIMDFYIAACADLPVYGYVSPLPYRWHDIGKPASLMAAQADFAMGNG